MGPSPVQTEPVKVLDHVAAVSCGWESTAAIREDGTLWVWGLSDCLGNGGAGNDTYEDAYGLGGYPIQTAPMQIMEDVTAFSMGEAHGAAVKSDGTLWTWGTNDCGELGTGNLEPSAVPVQVLDRVVDVSAGSDYTAAIRTDGTLWTWGSNFSGELGNGGEEDSLVPVQVLEDVSAVQTGVYTFRNQTLAVKTDGSVWAWGAGAVVSEDGVWDTADSRVPVECPDLHGSVPGSMDYARSVMARYDEPLITVDGDVWGLSAYTVSDANGNKSHYISLYELYLMMPEDMGVSIREGETVRFATGGEETEYDGEYGFLSFLPFQADRTYRPMTATVTVDGRPYDLSAIVLTDDDGAEYTYYKLRDLGQSLGFGVNWSAGTGVTVDFPGPGTEN